MLYVQVTRGAAERNLVFPRGARPTIVVTARPLKLNNGQPLRGIRVMTTPDIRWARVDIKSVALLPNLLAKQRAVEAGFDDVFFTDDDGLVTEASGANAWIVTKDRELVTRPLSNAILHGITRATAISLASTMNIKFSERAFSVAEAENASEAFITSATALVTPVCQVNQASLGKEEIGPFVRELCNRYRDYWTHPS
jgi:D-alanine transaminase